MPAKRKDQPRCEQQLSFNLSLKNRKKNNNKTTWAGSHDIVWTELHGWLAKEGWTTRHRKERNPKKEGKRKVKGTSFDKCYQSCYDTREVRRRRCILSIAICALGQSLRQDLNRVEQWVRNYEWRGPLSSTVSQWAKRPQAQTPFFFSLRKAARSTVTTSFVRGSASHS